MLPIAIGLFSLIAGDKLFTLYIRPQIDRAKVKKQRSQMFRFMTGRPQYIASTRNEAKQRFAIISFDPDHNSDPVIDPSDPTFPFKKYHFRMVEAEPLLRMSDPDSDETTSDYIGTMLRLKDSPFGSKPTLQLTGKHRVFYIVGGLNDYLGLYADQNDVGLPIKILEPGELESLRAARFGERARLRNSRNDELVSRWEHWEASVVAGKDYKGSFKWHPATGIPVPQTAMVRAIVTESKSGDATLTLTVAAQPAFELHLTGKIDSRVLAVSATYSFESLNFKARVLSNSDAEEIHGQVLGVLGGREMEGSLHLAKMSKADLIAEEEELESVRQVEIGIAKKRAESEVRNREVASLLNRKGGFQLILQTKGGESLAGKFESLQTSTTLAESKFRITVTTRDGVRYDHVLTGQLSEPEARVEQIILRSTRDSQNPLFEDLTVTLGDFDLGTKACSGDWKAHLPNSAAGRISLR